MGSKLSIIIPVFNTGECLEKCLQSVCGQTLKDVEILIIDDGSDAVTARLCDSFSSQDSRIRVVHKKNEGVSVARNIGISLATGYFVGFVDSDDWIAPDMFRCLTDKASLEQADIVMCDALTVRGDGKPVIDTFTQIPTSGFIHRNQIQPQILCEVAGAVWRCVYSRRFLTEHQLSFPVGLKLSEDRIFNILALGSASGFYYLKYPYYYRYVRKGSASFSYHPDATIIIAQAYKLINTHLSNLWNDSYVPVYQRQELALFYGSMNAILLAKDLSLRSYYQKMRDLCQNVEFRYLLSQTQACDLRARLVRKNQIVLLCILTYLLHIKHKILCQ